MAAQATSGASERQTVLVVDDSKVVRHTITRILGGDYLIVQAEDGMAGWNQAISDTVDLVISDINMPQLDGYGLICKLRAADQEKVRDVPIIVITSAEDETVRERAYACGANDFILKPFNAPQLLDCVRMHLAGQETRANELAERYGDHVETIMVSDAVDTTNDPLSHIDTGLNALKSMKTDQLVPLLPQLASRVVPFLRYWNTAYTLGIENEIAAIESRLTKRRS